LEWIGSPCSVTRKLVASLMYTHVGKDKNTLFWMDRWLNGCSIAELAPEVLSKVDKKVASIRVFLPLLKTSKRSS
jgi:hypothetical protein